ncbi:hypothetical protein Tco_1516813 [Tanacetum coccineum]
MNFLEIVNHNSSSSTFLVHYVIQQTILRILGKLQPKADIGIFIGYSPSKKAYQIYNKRTKLIMETMNVQFDKLTQMASEEHVPPDTAEASPSSTTIDKDALYSSTSPNNEPATSPTNSTNVEESHNEEVVMFNSDTFTNPFAPLVTSSAESSSRILDTSNMHTFQQPKINTRRWTKDHPLATIIESKNYKAAMIKSSWIEAMQEEIHEFERLEV